MRVPDFTNREPGNIIMERLFFDSAGFVYRGLSWGDYAKRNVGRRDALSCGLARLHGFIGGKPIQVTVSHGPGIEPCRCSGNTVLDA